MANWPVDPALNSTARESQRLLRMSPVWEEVAAKKKLDLLSKIPKEWLLESVPTIEEVPDASAYIAKTIPAEILKIVTTPGTELVCKIAKGQLTSYEVTKCFCHVAAVSHQLTNCLTEIFFDKALKQAKELDEYYATTGKTKGPLHGLPVSLKDQVNLEGIDTSIGYAAALVSDELQEKITGRSKHTKDSDSLIATLLQDAGAVFYVKTTVPMAMMSSDTRSTVYGATLNARNRNFSAGGSSGGEGALIACGGSLIGLGTDIGGSIRIPASFNGLFGLRPSSNRLPYLKVANSMADQPIVPSVIGPLAQNLDDIELLTKTIIDQEPWNRDTKCPPIPWRPFKIAKDQVFNFGFVESDELVNPHPAFYRAMDIVRTKLASAGHDIFEFKPPVPHPKISALVGDIFASDSMEEISGFAKLADEPVSDVVLALCPPPYKTVSVSGHWEQAKAKYEYQQAYNKGWLETTALTKNGKLMDFYLIPSWCSTSFKHGRIKSSFSTYTQYLNGLDYSVVIIPVTKVDKTKDVYPADYTPLNEKDEANFKEYDPNSYDGMPVSIQLVARKYEEEKVIAVAKLITSLL